MKSNHKKKSNKTKLSKSVNAALPIFALFGGQGFASSRNPLSLQSSKKISGKSVVYIHDIQTPEIPKISAKKPYSTTSSFAAFTHKSFRSIKNTEIKVQTNSLNFLKENNLLSSKVSITSHVSGNTQTRKSFADDFQWSSLSVNSGSYDYQNSNCIASATYIMNPIDKFYAYVNTGANNYLCALRNNGITLTRLSYSQGSIILSRCQAMHMACDGEPLPVELMKFEVD